MVSSAATVQIYDKVVLFSSVSSIKTKRNVSKKQSNYKILRYELSYKQYKI